MKCPFGASDLTEVLASFLNNAERLLHGISSANLPYHLNKWSHLWMTARRNACRRTTAAGVPFLREFFGGVGPDLRQGRMVVRDARQIAGGRAEMHGHHYSPLNYNRKLVAPKGQATRSPWQRHGFDPLQNRKPCKGAP